MDQIYNIPYRYKYVKSLKDRVKDLDSILQKYPDDTALQDMDPNDVTECIYSFGKTWLSLRNALEDVYFQNEIDEKTEREMRRILYDDLPILIEFDGEVLSIRTPLLVPHSHEYKYKKEYKRGLMQSFIMSDLVDCALNKLKTDKPTTSAIHKYFYDVPIAVVVVQRRDIGRCFGAAGIQINQAPIDLDNLELSRIINEIFGFLGRSDNPFSMTDLHLCTRMEYDDAKKGTEIYLTSADNLAKVLTHNEIPLDSKQYLNSQRNVASTNLNTNLNNENGENIGKSEAQKGLIREKGNFDDKNFNTDEKHKTLGKISLSHESEKTLCQTNENTKKNIKKYHHINKQNKHGRIGRT